MAEELLMPKLGMTMEEGILTEWFKQEARNQARVFAGLRPVLFSWASCLL